MCVPHSEAERVRPAPGRRSALTLLELLIAIALLAAMLALVAPNLLSQLDERRFDSTGDVLLQQLLVARAHAQMTGEAVEVRYIPPSQSRAARIESRLFLRVPLETWPDEQSEDSPRPNTSEPGDSRGDASADLTKVYEQWATQDLPEGYRVTDLRPGDANGSGKSQLDDSLAPVTLSPRGAEFASNIAAEEIRIALFLSDGSAIASTPRWLIDAGERSARIFIHTWTGLPVVTRVDPADDSQRISEAADDVGELATDAPRGKS